MGDDRLKSPTATPPLESSLYSHYNFLYLITNSITRNYVRQASQGTSTLRLLTITYGLISLLQTALKTSQSADISISAHREYRPTASPRSPPVGPDPRPQSRSDCLGVAR